MNAARRFSYGACANHPDLLVKINPILLIGLDLFYIDLEIEIEPEFYNWKKNRETATPRTQDLAPYSFLHFTFRARTHALITSQFSKNEEDNNGDDGENAAY